MEGIKENSDIQNKLSCDKIKHKLIYDKKNKVYKKTLDNYKSKVQKPKITVHEGKKLYDCKTCNLKFEHRGKLSKHLFKHISETHEEKKEEKFVSNDSGTKLNMNLKKRKLKQRALKIDGKKKLRSNLLHNSGNNETKELDKCDFKNVKKSRDGIKEKLRLKQQVSKFHEGKKLRSNLRHYSGIHQHKKLDNCGWFKRQQVLNARKSKIAQEKIVNQEKMGNEEKIVRKRKFQIKKKTENLSNTETDLKNSMTALIGKRKEKVFPSKKRLLGLQEHPCGQKEDYKEFQLPYGWKKTGQKRKDGERWDFYLFAPNGQKLRSNIEIKKYLENHPNVKCDMEVTKISSTFPTGKPKTRG